MKNLLNFLLVVLLLSAGVGAIYRYTSAPAVSVAQAIPQVATLSNHPPIDPSETDLLESLNKQTTRLISSVIPSVVSITAAKTFVPRSRDEEFFFWLFRGGDMLRQTSLGSGFIVSQEGHILTNNHVVSGVDEVKVQLNDGRTANARIVGADRRLDIAVLKIDLPNLKPLPLGDSDAVEVGERVFAIGNPLGLEETVTDGIVSAKGRRISDEAGVDYLQTNAVINPGNSGGPLVNIRGEVIGINTQIIANQVGSWQGYGFAIPANSAHSAMIELIQKGRIERGFLGVQVASLDAVTAARLGVKSTVGAFVLGVVEGSAAEAAGLMRGDIILAIDGKPIKDNIDLIKEISSTGPGREVALEIERNGVKTTVRVTIGQFSDEQTSARIQSGGPSGSEPRTPGLGGSGELLDGIKVVDLSPELRIKLQLPSDITGAVVESVTPNSPAARFLRPGDVIEAVQNQAVTDAESFKFLAKNIPSGRRVVLSIIRDGRRSFVLLRP